MIAVILLLAAGGWYSLRYFRRAPAAVTPAPPARAVQAAQAPATGAARRIQTPPFASLAGPVTPGFLNHVATTPDVKISLYYEGDERTPTDDMWYTEKKTITNEQGEDYLLMPSSIDTSVRYGPTEFQIFKNQESHAYQGIPVTLLNAAAKYSLQYVGLKINDPRMVSGLTIEVGVDYRAEEDGDVLDTPPSSPASMSPLSPWLSPSVVYACGPGLYLRPIGEARLLNPQTENGVAWYKLEKSIALYNLPLDYCDKPAGRSEPKKKPNARKEDEDEDDEEYCAPIKDLTGGQVRFHILYQPSGMEGPLQMQAVNFILQDEQGRYFQPVIGTNYARYYKAYLIDRQCFSSGKQPADCIRQ